MRAVATCPSSTPNPANNGHAEPRRNYRAGVQQAEASLDPKSKYFRTSLNIGIAIRARMRPETPQIHRFCWRAVPVSTEFPGLDISRVQGRRPPRPPDQRPRPKAIACFASAHTQPSREKLATVRANPRLAHTWERRHNVIHGERAQQRNAARAVSASWRDNTCSASLSQLPAGIQKQSHLIKPRVVRLRLRPCFIRPRPSFCHRFRPTASGACSLPACRNSCRPVQEARPLQTAQADAPGRSAISRNSYPIVSHHHCQAGAHAECVRSLAHLFAGGVPRISFSIGSGPGHSSASVRPIHPCLIVGELPARSNVPAMIGVQPCSQRWKDRVGRTGLVLSRNFIKISNGASSRSRRRQRGPSVKTEDWPGQNSRYRSLPSLGIPRPGFERLHPSAPFFPRCAHLRLVSAVLQRCHKLLRRQPWENIQVALRVRLRANRFRTCRCPWERRLPL